MEHPKGIIMAVKSFLVQTRGGCTIKYFTAVIFAGVFATVSHLYTSLVFTGKARACQSRAPHTNSWLTALPTNIDLGGRD